MRRLLVRTGFFIFGISVVGCTFKGLVYQNLDWLAMRNLNQYFNLNAQQEKQFESKVKTLVNELKPMAIQGFVPILQLAKSYTQDGTFSAIEQQDIEGRFFAFRATIIRKIAPDTAYFFKQLSTEQLHFFRSKANEEHNKWIRELAEANPKDFPKLLEDRLEKSFERYETWLGDLTEKQKSMIKSYWPSNPKQASHWLDSRVRQQAVFVDLMMRLNQKEIEAFIYRWADDMDYLKILSGDKPEDHSFQKFLRSLRKTYTKKQVKHLNEKIAETISDLSSL